MVINLSSAALDDDKIKLLSRGLSFCPTPQQANTCSEAVLDDLEGYFRCLRLKELFLDEDDEEEESNNAATQIQFRPPSMWMPPKGRDAALETYIKKFRTDVERQALIFRVDCYWCCYITL